MSTKEDLNEATEEAVDCIRSWLKETDGKMEQRHYNGLADVIFAFLTSYVKST